MPAVARRRLIIKISGRDRGIAVSELSRNFEIDDDEAEIDEIMAEFEKDRENHRIQSLIAGGRWKAQLKQRALAEMIGVSQSSISDYETGRKKPTADTLLKICQVLKVSESKAEKALAMLK